MPVLNVRRYGDPILRQKAQPVEAVTPEIRKTLADMLETLYHQVGIGLAAPQVGIPPPHHPGRRRHRAARAR